MLNNPYISRHGHLSICELIVDIIEDHEPINSNGLTPLHLAARNGYEKICQLLVENVNNEYPVDPDGDTALHMAAKYGHYEVIQFPIMNMDHLLSKHYENRVLLRE